MAVTPARRTALEVLRQVGRGRRLDLAFASAAPGLPPRERRLLQELTYGTVRFRGRIDHLLDHHLRKGKRSLSPALLDVLRLGAHQLLHLDGVPPWAAVSQAVEQARGLGGRGAASLVNGVLRAVQRTGLDPALFPSPDADPAGHLATWGSHPRWLVERWLSRWSPEEVRALVEEDNRVPPLTLVPLRHGPAEALERLRAAGLEGRVVGEGTGAVELLPGSDPVAALAALPAIVQDPGAALVTAFVDPPAGSWVADLCAAPGGKALALARGGAYVLAADRSLRRLRLVQQNRDRTGVRVGVVAARAEQPPLRPAPVVLVDVPCTGTGTLRRHPDARWRLETGDVTTLAGVQEGILDGAAAVVPSAGLLVYSTCSLEREENEDQVEAFLARHPDFHVERTDAVPEGFLDDRGRLVVSPARTGFDGAFAARLRRAP